MKKLILGSTIFILIISAIIIIPMVVDLNQYKPVLEQKISTLTGRPFKIKGALKISLFPWAGVSLADISLDSPSEFDVKNFISVKSLDVSIKVMPLFSKEIEVRQFKINHPQIILVKNKQGRGNWEGLGKSGSEHSAQKKSEEQTELPIKSFLVEEFAINNGLFRFSDQATGSTNEIKDINLKLEDLSFDQPVQINFSALINNMVLELAGQAGPFGKNPGQTDIAFDFNIKALKQIELVLKGQVLTPADNPQVDLTLEILPFSLRTLLSKMEIPSQTSDPDAFKQLGLHAVVKAGRDQVSVSEAQVRLDDSNLKFNLNIHKQGPQIAFNLDLDKINLNRYLPPEQNAPPAESAEKPPRHKEKIDYQPLRKMVIDGNVQADEIQIRDAVMQDLKIKIAGQKGIFTLDPFTVNAFEATPSIKARMDFRQDTPKTDFSFAIDKINVGRACKELLKFNRLAGNAGVKIDLNLTGDQPEQIKKTLNGKIKMNFKEGRIQGLDLIGMFQNITGQKQHTEFGEMLVDLEIKNGLMDVLRADLLTRLLKVKTRGQVDLVKETLDLRIDPNYLEKAEKFKILVPVTVTGTFTEPKYKLHLQGGIKKVGEKILESEKLKPYKEKIKGLFF